MAQLINQNHPIFRMGTSQTVSITSTSTASSATSAAADGDQSIQVVTLYATVDCFLAFGSSPTATSAGHFVGGGERMYMRMAPGDKVAAIRSGTDGTLYMTELGA